jgi:PAS domain S-box-containing protein
MKPDELSLREKAEKRLSHLDDNVWNMPVDDVKKLAHELQVYKAELEIQNEELLQAQINLQRTSEHFFNLFNHAPVGYLILDEKGLIAKSNYTFSNMSQYTIEEITNSNIIKFIDHSSRDYFLSRFQAFYNHPSNKNIEVKIRKKSKDLFIARIEGTRLTFQKDSPQDPDLLIAIIDITEKVKQEEDLKKYRNHLEELVEERTKQLNQLNQTLSEEIEKRKEYEVQLESLLRKEKEVNEMKSRFISTTSHEFRTPLASILSSIEILERYSDKLPAERKAEHFSKIKQAINYVTDLLNDLLMINKSEIDRLHFKPEKIDLPLLIQDCLDRIKYSSDEKFVFTFNFASDQAIYYLDYRLMNFVLNNLLSNAVKFSPNGGNIEVSVKNLGNNLIISVKDQGLGIDSDEIEKIFEPFYRGKNSTTTKGTGLGLSIVKNAVEVHKGTIEVKSQPNLGTEFILTIPILN